MKRTCQVAIFAAVVVTGITGVIWRVLAPLKLSDKPLVQTLPVVHPSTFAGLPSNPTPAQIAERIHALGRNIPLSEQRALIIWINGPKPTHISSGIWHWLVNDVMDKLCHQTIPLPEWTDALLGIYWGTSNDPVLRDYSLQHLVDWIQPISVGEPSETNPQKRSGIIDAMIDAAGQPRQHFSGTAIQALHHILLSSDRALQLGNDSQSLTMPFSADQLRPIAIKLAGSPEASMLARITAIQVCAQRGFQEILPSARNIATDTKQPISLRLSAIAVVGQLGSSDDELMLEKLQDQRQPRILAAVRPALKRIKQQAGVTHSITTK